MEFDLKVGAAVVGLLLAAPGFAGDAGAAGSQATLIPFSLQFDPLRQQCWIEHAQVQPGPLAQEWRSQETSAIDPGLWRKLEIRAGAEHWNIAEVKRACRLQRAQAAASDRVAAEFLAPQVGEFMPGR